MCLKRRSIAHFIVAAASVLVFAGCTQKDPGGKQQAPTEPARPSVVATTSIIADLVRQIAGDKVRVDGLMGPGVDPHLYKATAGDVQRMVDAGMVLYNGLHLEGKMVDVFESMRRLGKKTVAVTDGIAPDRLIAVAGFGGTHDPHVWFDVSLWMDAAEVVRGSLVELDPANGPVFNQRAEAYRAQLEDLHRFAMERCAEVPKVKRVLITAHDAFNYFGRAYGFEVKGLLGVSTASEAGTSDVQKLADMITRRNIPAVFVETTVPRRYVEALRNAVQSRRATVRIGGSLFSDALGSPGTPEETYVGMVRYNVNTIVDALLDRALSQEEGSP